MSNFSLSIGHQDAKAVWPSAFSGSSLLPETRVHLADLPSPSPPPDDRSRSSYFRAIQPSPPVSRQTTLLRGTCGEFSMEFSSADTFFARLPLSMTTARIPVSPSPAVSPKYGQIPFRLLMANYVIAARWDRKRGASKTTGWSCGSGYYYTFLKRTFSSPNYILLHFWPRIFLMTFIREYN